MQTQTSVLHIGKKMFLNVTYMLLGLMLAAGILSKMIRPGMYQRDLDGSVIEGSFQFVTGVNYPIWRWLIAPIEVLYSSDALQVIVISIFLLILGGTFYTMDKTGGIHVLIRRLVIKYQHQKYVLLRLIILLFMMFGAFFGIFEESLALLPILILVALSMGWDSMTGLGMSLLAAGFGFASAVTNPFSIGVASSIAEIPILSGVLYRLLIFGVMYFLLQFFLVRYAKKIEASPHLSVTYETDLGKHEAFDLNQVLPFPNEPLIFKSYTMMFIALIIGIFGAGILELFFNLSIPAIPIMALIFLLGGLISSLVVTKRFKLTLMMYLKGMLGVAPAILLILLAVSVKHIITEAQVMDSILFYLASALENTSPMVGIVYIFLLVLVIQFFIGSASAKAFLIMPILIPLVQMIGITKSQAILAFVFADGYTNVIFPTNAVLLIGLSMAQVGYQKWFKFTYKLQILTFFLSILFLMIAVWIQY